VTSLQGCRRESTLPVYLVHWNAPLWCVSAARSLARSSGVAVDLTVVDNGQAGGAPLSSQLPNSVRVLASPENVGFAGAANIAIDDWRSRHPSGELCMIGSHDLHVEPDTLARLVDTARRNPRSGLVAPALVGPYASAGGSWNGRHAYQHSLDGSPELVSRSWASGTCLLLRRACVDDVGRFDENLGSYVEDVDYGLRVNAAGWDVLVATTATAWGLGTASPTEISLIAGNTVLLSLKLGGVRGGLATTSLFVFWTARGFVAGMLPWRDGARRALSRRYAVQRTIGLWRVLRSGKLIDVLRERNGRSPDERGVPRL
jgi:hypothetical protein